MNIIFNSSMPRSGSTLLQNILAQNPRIFASPTSGVLELLYGARKNFTDCPEFKAQDQDVMDKGFAGFCAGGLQGWYSTITNKPIVVDKSRGWIAYYEWMAQFIENPKIIVCVRDLRSILASMEKIHRKTLHRSDAAENPTGLQFVTVQQRVNSWLSNQPIGLSLMRVFDAIQRGTINHMCIIRYEDLMVEPHKVMKKIYTYLGEEPFIHDFQTIPQVTVENDGIHGVYGNHKIRNTLEAATTDAGLLLGDGICNDIVNGNRWYFDCFYSPNSNFL